jgi:hypothetical protein
VCTGGDAYTPRRESTGGDAYTPRRESTGGDAYTPRRESTGRRLYAQDLLEIADAHPIDPVIDLKGLPNRERFDKLLSLITKEGLKR